MPATSFTSSPAQNVSPAPEITTTLSLLRVSSQPKRCARVHRLSCTLIALAARGRFNITVAMRFATLTVIVSNSPSSPSSGSETHHAVLFAQQLHHIGNQFVKLDHRTAVRTAANLAAANECLHFEKSLRGDRRSPLLAPRPAQSNPTLPRRYAPLALRLRPILLPPPRTAAGPNGQTFDSSSMIMLMERVARRPCGRSWRREKNRSESKCKWSIPARQCWVRLCGAWRK